MPEINLTAPSAYDPQMLAIARQQKLAEMLSQMGAQEIPVSSAGGISAPISPMSALVKGLSSFGGSYLAGQAENKAKDYENSKLSDALMAKMAGSNIDPNTISSATSTTPEQPGFFDRAANFLGIGGNQEKPAIAGPAAPPNTPTAPIDAEGTPTGTYILPPTPASAPQPKNDAEGTPTSSYMPSQQPASPNAAPVLPYLAKLDQQAKYYTAYNPTTLQGRIDQQTGLIGIQQNRKDYLNNLPRYQALLAAAPPENRPQLQDAINTNNTALLDKYEGTQLDKSTPQTTMAPKLNPMDQAKYNAMINSGLSPQAYEAQGEAAKAKAELPFKVQTARDAAAARLEAQTSLIASNPDAVSLGADYFIAKGGVYPPNARTAAMQLAISSLANERMKQAGVSMDDLVNKGITIKANTEAAGATAKTQAQTAVNEGTVNNSINIVKKLLPTAASQGDFTDINQLGQSLARKTNDHNAVLLKNGIDAISGEYARVMTGTTGGTPTSDAARKEAGNRILLGYNGGTIDATLTQLQQEMAGRSNSQANVLGNLTGGQYKAPPVPFSPATGGAGGAAAPGGAVAPGGATPAPSKTIRFEDMK